MLIEYLLLFCASWQSKYFAYSLARWCFISLGCNQHNMSPAICVPWWLSSLNLIRMRGSPPSLTASHTISVCVCVCVSVTHSVCHLFTLLSETVLYKQSRTLLLISVATHSYSCVCSLRSLITTLVSGHRMPLSFFYNTTLKPSISMWCFILVRLYFKTWITWCTVSYRHTCI